jgi:hypothetical protein
MPQLLTIPTSYRSGMSACVQREDGAADVELLAAKAMMGLSVKGTIAQQSADRRPGAGLPHHQWQERRVVTRAFGDDRRQQQVTAVIAYQPKLQPRLIAMSPWSTPSQEMRAGMMIFETGCVDAGRDVLGSQQKFFGPCPDLVEQLCAPPFLASRWAAFWRVVK